MCQKYFVTLTVLLECITKMVFLSTILGVRFASHNLHLSYITDVKLSTQKLMPCEGVLSLFSKRISEC
jgi:hypothetical protein